MFREWFPEDVMSGGSVMVFPLSKMNILRDEGRGPSFISVHTPLRVLAGTLVHLLRPTSTGGTAKGGVSSYILFVSPRRSNQNFRHLAWVSTIQHLRRH
jgi:hypothetical protein